MRLPAWEFDSVYESFSRMVYWTAYGALKSESDALDVSQEVFIRVLRHMKKLEDMSEAQLKSWLYRVTVNLCVDGKRRLKREVLADELPETPVSSECELPEPAAMNAETVRLVRGAVDSLPDIYRETVTLHYFSGLQYEEIAALQGVSEGTIKSRMSRAKGRLGELLKGGELHG
jgi:RNA polymerase sigma-70 factor (ECF subfamily)